MIDEAVLLGHLNSILTGIQAAMELDDPDMVVWALTQAKRELTEVIGDIE